MAQRHRQSGGGPGRGDTIAATGPGAPDASRRFVRITGRRGALIEFEFAIGDPELHVDLVLPEPAFAEFCRREAVEILEGSRAPDARDWSMRRAALGAVPDEP